MNSNVGNTRRYSRLALHTAMACIAITLSGCHLDDSRAISAHDVQSASPCVRQFMVAYAKKYNGLLTYKKLGRAEYACRLLANIKLKKRAYPSDSCIGKLVHNELHAKPSQLVLWMTYPDTIGLIRHYPALGYEPSIHDILSWSSIETACYGKANTASQVAALNMLRNAKEHGNVKNDGDANQSGAVEP